MEKKFNFRANNLNFIRLFAAIQVMIGHLHVCFDVPSLSYLTCFNGVPIFFTISGFLIFWSFDNNPNVKSFFRNRFLRIYPALVFCLILTIIALFIFRIITWSILTNSSFYLWIVTQLTFFQEFAPVILRGYGGGGAPNPPLWTISVEMLLYFSIPILHYLIRNISKIKKIVIIVILGLISYIQNQTDFISDSLSSLFANGYYLVLINPFNQLCSFYFFFSIGFIVYLYKEKIIPFLENKALYVFILYLITSGILYYNGMTPGAYDPNVLELLNHFILVLLIFSVAYTKPKLTEKYMGNTDISYGLYIFHMVIMNAFIELGFRDDVYIFPYLICSLFVAWLSWKYVEKQALKLKHNSLFKILHSK